MNIDRFLEAAFTVDEVTTASLANDLDRFRKLLESRRVLEEDKRKALKQISGYLAKKCKELQPERSANSVSGLRRVRNELAHGKSSSIREYSVLYPRLWRAIAELGKEMDVREMENLLAYHLSVPNLKLSSQGEELAKMIGSYKKIFDAFPAPGRAVLFKNLILGLFTDSYSWEILERVER